MDFLFLGRSADLINEDDVTDEENSENVTRCDGTGWDMMNDAR